MVALWYRVEGVNQPGRGGTQALPHGVRKHFAIQSNVAEGMGANVPGEAVKLLKTKTDDFLKGKRQLIENTHRRGIKAISMLKIDSLSLYVWDNRKWGHSTETWARLRSPSMPNPGLLHSASRRMF